MRFAQNIRPVAGRSVGTLRPLGHNLMDRLVEWWPLSEQSGDRLGVHAGLHLTDTNTVTGADGVGSLASHCTAANSESLERAGDDAVFEVGNAPWTMTGWVRFTTVNLTFQKLWGKWNSAGTSQRSYLLAMTGTGSSPNNTAMLFVSPDGSASTTVQCTNFGAFSAGVWYFVASWYTGSAIALSVNNGTANTAAHSTGMFNSTTPWKIATSNEPSDNFLNGDVQRVGLWKRQLSAGELTHLYNGGRGRDYPFI